MSVYTPLSEADVEVLLERYPASRLASLTPIAEGIENTNYFVDTDTDRYVLTIFESTPGDALGFYLELMAYLADRGIPAAHPIATSQGGYLVELKDKPAALVRRLSGASVTNPNHAQSFEIGKLLAEMHEITRNFPRHRADDRGWLWRERTAARVRDRIPAMETAILDEEIEYHSARPRDGLPSGVIHADLFRDNALFEGNSVSGVIDFYYAHSGPFIYDVAVTAADWGFVARNALDRQVITGLIAGYRSVREFQTAERDAWLRALRLAALRFWLSRLHDSLFPRHGAVTQTKDPEPFKTLISECRTVPDKYASLLT